MTIRQFVYRSIIQTLLLTALLPLATANAAQTADGFWGHRIGLQVDVAYGENPAQVFDLYLYGQRTGEPDYFAIDNDPRPILVWIHGGGWIAGDKAAEVPQLIPYLERGWNVVNVNYRQGPGTAPKAVDDVMCAYQRVIEIVEASGIPTDQVVVSGASAGGHLALLVGMLNSDGNHPCRTASPPKAVVNWFGITDIEAVQEFLSETRPEGNYAAAWIGNAAKVNEISSQYSPLFLVTENTPPIITVHGDVDTVVPYEQASALHESLSTANRLITIEDGNHSGFSDAQYRDAFQAIFQFIDDL
jgi:acetyl esterase/lipase